MKAHDDSRPACLAELSGVTKRFGAVQALDRLDLQVRRGELLAVLGPNGAGKSTAIAVMLGLQTPDTGVARLWGQAPRSLAARRRVGVMMQEVTLAAELRAREHIQLVSSYYPSPLTLGEVADLTRTEPLLHRPYGKLSGGQKRLVQFAMALCGRPQLLFLDEPTTGLDVQARTLVWAAIRRLLASGVSVVLSTHYLEEVEALATRVVVLAKGRVVATGTVNEIRSVVDRKRILCSTRLPAGEIAGWTDVESVERDRDRLTLTVHNAELVVRRLLAADAHLRDLEVLRAGLNEAFAEITQEKAR